MRYRPYPALSHAVAATVLINLLLINPPIADTWGAI